MAGDPDITYDYYHCGHQVVEVRKDGDADPYEQVVWDGMAASGGRLYLSTADGQVVCLGE